MVERGVTVAVVDDNIVDVVAIKRAFSSVDGCTVRTFSDRHQALRALKTGGLRWPYILLVDISMSDGAGLELLRKLRADSELSPSIVFVVTHSEDTADRRAAYEHNVAGYLIKRDLGPSCEGLVDLVKAYLKANAFAPDPAES